MKKTKGIRPRIWAGIVISVIAFMLAGFGCGKAEPDPNSGVYEGVSAEMMGISMSIDEIYEGGVTFELKDGGKGTCTIDGTDYKIKWTLDGDTFHAEGGGAEFDGTLSNGVMQLEDLMGMGVNMTFVCAELSDGATGTDGSSDEGVLVRLKDAKSGEEIYVEE